MAHKYLGEILIDEGLLSREDLARALQAQKKQLGEILLDMGCLESEDLDRALEIQAKGRTRAQVYAVYLRVALTALAIVSLLGCYALVTLLGEMRFEEKLQQRALESPEVLAILESDRHSAGVRLDALRSVATWPRPDEQSFMLRRALQDPNWSVRLIALHHVRSLGLESMVVDLVPLLLDEEAAVREEALRLVRGFTGEDLGEDFKAWYRWARDQGMQPIYPERLKNAVP